MRFRAVLCCGAVFEEDFRTIAHIRLRNKGYCRYKTVYESHPASPDNKVLAKERLLPLAQLRA